MKTILLDKTCIGEKKTANIKSLKEYYQVKKQQNKKKKSYLKSRNKTGSLQILH